MGRALLSLLQLTSDVDYPVYFVPLSEIILDRYIGIVSRWVVQSSNPHTAN